MALFSKSVPRTVVDPAVPLPTLAEVHPPLGEIDARLAELGVRERALLARAEELKPQFLNRIATPTRPAPDPDLVNALGTRWADLAGKAAGTDVPTEWRELCRELDAIAKARELLSHQRQLAWFEASRAVCDAARPDYEQRCQEVVDAAMGLLRALRREQALVSAVEARHASPVSLNLMHTRSLSDALVALLKDAMRYGRAPRDLRAEVQAAAVEAGASPASDDPMFSRPVSPTVTTLLTRQRTGRAPAAPIQVVEE